jgi:hypothetical protein
LWEATCDASAHVLPWLARGFTCQDSPRAFLDLLCPGSLHRRRVVRTRLIEAGEELGGDIGTFVAWQRQGFAKKLLRSLGHGAILNSGKAAQQAAAPDGGRGVTN